MDRTDVPSSVTDKAADMMQQTERMMEYNAGYTTGQNDFFDYETVDYETDAYRPGAAWHERAALSRQRRCRQVNRIYAAAAVISAVIILICCLLVFGLSSDAADRKSGRTEGGSDCKYFKSVMLTYDTGIKELAGLYADPEHYADAGQYIAEVCEINHLGLYYGNIEGAGPGTHIIVPYFASKRR